jgi:GTP pyrophosphokinase
MSENASLHLHIDLEAEKKEILRRYRTLLRSLKGKLEKGDKLIIRKAFDLAVEMHKDMRRKSGEPYIYHPIAVAQIVVDEIGLGPTAVVCALLHDVVEDTDVTLEDIKSMFGDKVMQIIDGLTKISGVIIDENSSIQAENFRKMLLTLSDDVRVILIKLADRLHNMRTLESMSREKQLKIASETSFLYAPLAHRLGLYSVKTELEDLSLKFKEPDVYNLLESKLAATQKERNRYINKFSLPIINLLTEKGFVFNIKGRVKSINSIWEKMKKQNIPFEEVYDVFAIRIIVDPASPEEEKNQCFSIFSSLTDLYQSNRFRTRDWITTPRANGYESLHTTLLGPEGKWVEVQIRSVRMDDVAEKGYAAHWKYKDKENAKESALDEWIRKIREVLESADTNALDFVDDVKLQLFAEEIFTFTPKGELKRLPNGATALDFAYEIHTKIGDTCIGAKVNNKLVALSHKLRSGDQVEILTSSKQTPKEEWLSFAITARAKTKVKEFIRDFKKKKAKEGVEIFDKKMNQLKIENNENNRSKIIRHFNFPNEIELFYRLAIKAVDIIDLKKYIVTSTDGIPSLIFPRKEVKQFEKVVTEIRGKQDALMLDGKQKNLKYNFSDCCHPIKGDDVFGFVTEEGINIHRTNCSHGLKLMSNFGSRIVKAKWIANEKISFLAGIMITGTDEIGIVNNITKIISDEYNVNMRSISFDTDEGLFEGKISVYVFDTNHLDALIKKLKKVPGVVNAYRMDSN